MTYVWHNVGLQLVLDNLHIKKRDKMKLKGQPPTKYWSDKQEKMKLKGQPLAKCLSDNTMWEKY